VYVPIRTWLSGILLLSLRPTLRVQDARTLMNFKEYYSKLIAPHRDMTELIELREDTRFALFYTRYEFYLSIHLEITMLSFCAFFMHICSDGDEFP
jgi:hypothetical protein